MSKHTPEPFEIRLVHTSGRGQVLLECHRPSDKYVPSVSLQFPVEIAERIKAEHEALAGLNPDAVPDLLAACKALRAAMFHSNEIGCTDHLDAADDGGAFWHDSLNAADAAIAKAEAQP